MLRGAAVLALAAGPALAGAWTQPPGTWFVSGSTSYYATDDGNFEEATASTYAEWGWREGLTLAGALETSRPVGVSRDAPSDVTLALWGRARLHVGRQGDPVSVQLGAILPLGEIADTGQAQIDGERAVDARLLYGRGFATGWGDAFVDLQGGFRLRLDDAADEIRIDLTAGLRPASGWLVMAQSFNTIGLRNPNAGGDDFDVFKLAPAVGYEVVPGVTLLGAVEREIAGRGIDRGLRLRAALWTTF